MALPISEGIQVLRQSPTHLRCTEPKAELTPSLEFAAVDRVGVPLVPDDEHAGVEFANYVGL
jgi:hypothetical protein